MHSQAEDNTPKPRILFPEGSEEIIVHWPNGKIEFLGLWGMVKLAWWVAKTGQHVTIVDPKTNKETEA